MLSVVDPILQKLVDSPVPFPLILLASSSETTRSIITKVHPFDSKEILPTWEKMSLKNIPFVIWLDQLVATAQRQGGFGSDYVVPYWNLDT